MVKTRKQKKVTFIVSHPTGNTFVRALVEELYQNELLEYFFTTIGFGENSGEIFFDFKKKEDSTTYQMLKLSDFGIQSF